MRQHDALLSDRVLLCAHDFGKGSLNDRWETFILAGWLIILRAEDQTDVDLLRVKVSRLWCFAAHLVDLLDQWISDWTSKSEDIPDDAILEGCPTWVNSVEPAKLGCHIESSTTHFSALMRAPLTSELSQLFIIFSQNQLYRLLSEVSDCLRFLSEQL